jgi:hypothetical protein
MIGIILILSILIACIALLAEWYTLFFLSIFVMFVAIVAWGIKMEDKVDVSHMPRSRRNAL